MIIGYARVSSKSQKLDRQIYELEKFGCNKIFREKKSGKNFKDRTVYNEMKNQLRFHDVLVIQDLSRLGRNKKEIKKEWEWLVNNEIDIVVLNMPILDTRKYKEFEGMGELFFEIVLSLLSWMVEEERNRIKESQKEGILKAQKQGKFKGRPLKYHKDAKGKDKIIYDDIVSKLKQEKSVKDIHIDTDVSRNTIYRIKREINQEMF